MNIAEHRRDSLFPGDLSPSPRSLHPLCEEAKRQFFITDRSAEELSFGNEVRQGHLFQTEKQGSWLVIPPTFENQLVVKDSVFKLNGAGKVLSSRQKFGRPSDATCATHQRNIQFFLANWKTLSPLFYRRARFGNTGESASFGEVDLNDFKFQVQKGEEERQRTCGRIDFLGFGPDGTAIPIDFAMSTSGKCAQLRKQQHGLQEVIASHDNSGILSIRPFIGLYSLDRASWLTTVEIVPPPVELTDDLLHPAGGGQIVLFHPDGKRRPTA